MDARDFCCAHYYAAQKDRVAVWLFVSASSASVWFAAEEAENALAWEHRVMAWRNTNEEHGTRLRALLREDVLCIA